MKSAEKFLEQNYTTHGLRTLINQNGEFFKYAAGPNYGRDGLAPFKPNRDTIGNLIEALAARSFLLVMAGPAGLRRPPMILRRKKSLHSKAGCFISRLEFCSRPIRASLPSTGLMRSGLSSHHDRSCGSRFLGSYG